MFGPIECVVFDFDGTLVDTMSSVIRGLSEAIRLTVGQAPSADELVASFGPAPQEVLRKWMPEQRVVEALAHWMAFEKNLAPAEMKAFSGVVPMLQSLKDHGIPIGIFTGRDRAGTLRIAGAHQWLGVFFNPETMVCGDDGFATKPQPDALAHLLKKLNWPPARTLMVGDHPYDMMAGRAAGTKTAAALWDHSMAQARVPAPDQSGAPATAATIAQSAVGKTPRALFRESWTKWDGVEADLRLSTPLSLSEWLAR